MPERWGLYIHLPMETEDDTDRDKIYDLANNTVLWTNVDDGTLCALAGKALDYISKCIPEPNDIKGNRNVKKLLVMIYFILQSDKSIYVGYPNPHAENKGNY